MLDSWQQENVNTTDLIQRMADRLPGLYYIETDDTGERTFYYWRNEAAAKFWLESDRAAAICEELATFDYLYLSGISLAILSPASRDKLFTLLRECRANGGKVIFDNNYRPRLWASQAETQQVYQEMLACTDIAFLTLDDEDALWGEKPVAEVIARTHAAGVEEVVVKRGADACLVSVSGQTAAGSAGRQAGQREGGGYHRRRRLLQRRLPGRSPDRRRCRIRRQTRTPDRQHGDPVSRGDHPAGSDAAVILRTKRSPAAAGAPERR